MADEAIQRRGNGFKDITGQRFGRLTAVEYLGAVKIGNQGQRKSLWRCTCDCGRETRTYAPNLRKGTTKSCGCWQQEVRSLAHTTHGMRRTPEYDAWCRMIRRCTAPKEKNNRWENYAGRGIGVCREWRESFEEFFAHVGHRPSPEHSLDRVNNDGNYEPGNVRWATRSEQMLNRRKYVVLKNRKSHCPSGHPYDETNTYWYRGGKICLVCKRRNARERMRRWRARQREQKAE